MANLNLPWKKSAPELPVVRNVRTVSELVTSFTSQFKEVADANAKIVTTQEAVIKAAQEKKLFAESEKAGAENFIANFQAMRSAPPVK
jgi:hypothetical protein